LNLSLYSANLGVDTKSTRDISASPCCFGK
jgi:hypothetical protein